MIQTLLTFYCIGATFAIPIMAALLVAARSRIKARDAEIVLLKKWHEDELIANGKLFDEVVRLRRERVPCDPPPGCVGATATSRAQRAHLAEVLARQGAAPGPWRRYQEPGGGVYGYRIVGDGSPMPPVGLVTGPSWKRDPLDPPGGDAHSEIICEARNMAPDLLADIETLLGDVERLQTGMALVIVERDAAQAQVRTALAIAALPADGGGS